MLFVIILSAFLYFKNVIFVSMDARYNAFLFTILHFEINPHVLVNIDYDL